MALNRLLVQHLAACNAINLAAELGDFVLVPTLHLGLLGAGKRDNVVAKHQISGCGQIKNAEEDAKECEAGNNPWPNDVVLNRIAMSNDDTMRFFPPTKLSTSYFRKHSTPSQ